MSNQPERLEKFLVPTGVPKVAYKKDTKVKDAATFIIQREDHTLGNVIRHKLLEDQDVIFAAYRIPHPLEHVMHLRVQTNGKKSPAQAVLSAIDGIVWEVERMQTQFDQQFEEKSDLRGLHDEEL